MIPTLSEGVRFSDSPFDRRLQPGCESNLQQRLDILQSRQIGAGSLRFTRVIPQYAL